MTWLAAACYGACHDGQKDSVQMEQKEHRGAFFIEGEGRRLAELTFSATPDRKLVILDHTDVWSRSAVRESRARLVEAAVVWARRTNVSSCRSAPSRRRCSTRRAGVRRRQGLSQMRSERSNGWPAVERRAGLTPLFLLSVRRSSSAFVAGGKARALAFMSSGKRRGKRGHGRRHFSKQISRATPVFWRQVRGPGRGHLRPVPEEARHAVSILDEWADADETRLRRAIRAATGAANRGRGHDETKDAAAQRQGQARMMRIAQAYRSYAERASQKLVVSVPRPPSGVGGPTSRRGGKTPSSRPSTRALAEIITIRSPEEAKEAVRKLGEWG